jgi:hypothetical protein
MQFSINALPVLLTIVCAPVVLDRVTLFEPAVTVHVVDAPAEDVNVIWLAYPEGVWPLNH